MSIHRHVISKRLMQHRQPFQPFHLLISGPPGQVRPSKATLRKILEKVSSMREKVTVRSEASHRDGMPGSSSDAPAVVPKAPATKKKSKSKSE